MTNNINLSTLFQTVTERLTESKEQLNQADSFNHDHGDHMVEIFQLIQTAVSKKSDAPINQQLEYASEVVAKESDNGSAKLYSEGLSKAAAQYSGTELNQDNIGNLVKSLLGAEDDGDPQRNSQFGSLLSSLSGKNQADESKSSFNVNDLFRAGMIFFQSKQKGSSNVDAVLEANFSASPLVQSAHRSQSGMLVASTIDECCPIVHEQVNKHKALISHKGVP